MGQRDRLARLAALVMMLVVGGCASSARWHHRHGADNPLVGTILEVATGHRLSEAELAERLKDHAIVLVGETTGNADQSALASGLVRSLAGDGRRLASLALESLPTDTQPLIVEYQSAHPGDGRGLDRVLQAAAPDRPHLAQYSSVVVTAVGLGAQIVAADLSTDIMRAVMTQGFGALQPSFVRRTGLAESFATPIQESLRSEMAVAACGLVDERGTAALVRARRARDATMADRLSAVTGRGQTVLVAAVPHVRQDRGVPWYLRQLRPAALVASIAFVELPDAHAEPTDLPYDYVWFTPAREAPKVVGCSRQSPDEAPAGGTPSPADVSRATSAAFRF